MNVSFSDPDVARLVNSMSALTARFGEPTARIVLRRLCQLDAVADLDQAGRLPGIRISGSSSSTAVSFPGDRLAFLGTLELARRRADGGHVSFVIAKLTVRTRSIERSAR